MYSNNLVAKYKRASVGRQAPHRGWLLKPKQKAIPWDRQQNLQRQGAKPNPFLGSRHTQIFDLGQHLPGLWAPQPNPSHAEEASVSQNQYLGQHIKIRMGNFMTPSLLILQTKHMWHMTASSACPRSPAAAAPGTRGKTQPGWSRNEGQAEPMASAPPNPAHQALPTPSPCTSPAGHKVPCAWFRRQSCFSCYSKHHPQMTTLHKIWGVDRPHPSSTHTCRVRPAQLKMPWTWQQKD